MPTRHLAASARRRGEPSQQGFGFAWGRRPFGMGHGEVCAASDGRWALVAAWRRGSHSDSQTGAGSRHRSSENIDLRAFESLGHRWRQFTRRLCLQPAAENQRHRAGCFSPIRRLPALALPVASDLSSPPVPAVLRFHRFYSRPNQQTLSAPDAHAPCARSPALPREIHHTVRFLPGVKLDQPNRLLQAALIKDHLLTRTAQVPACAVR